MNFTIKRVGRTVETEKGGKKAIKKKGERGTFSRLLGHAVRCKALKHGKTEHTGDDVGELPGISRLEETRFRQEKPQAKNRGKHCHGHAESGD